MKNTVMGLLVISLIGGTLTSCKKKEGCTDPIASNFDPDADKDCCCEYAPTASFETINGVDYYYVSGDINADMTLTSDRKWLLSGGVFVQSPAILTIEPGTEIYGDDGSATAFIAVQRGAKIMANGTASQPIVMSTIKKVIGGAAPGDWGGVIINGYGVLNAGATAEGEGGTGTYGGNDNSDNSGTMRYVRLEYAGRVLGTDIELNGFSFNGVGSGTTLEYLQAYKGSDDGFEFFGGAANLKYAVSTGNSDDSFDWTQGWQGKGQFWVVQQDPSSGDRGMECDNWETNMAATPHSNPTISNFTLTGADDGSANDGVRLRHGTKGKLHNGLVTGFAGNGIRVQAGGDPATDHMNAMPPELVVSNTTSFGNGTDWKDCDSFMNDPSNSSSNVSMNGYVGTDASSFDPSTIDAWFNSATYKGAVESGNDWTAGWTVGL